MKKTIFWKTYYMRRNLLKQFFLDFFISLASWPTLMLEVFIRKNLGERYFSFASAITVAFILFFIPLGLNKVMTVISYHSGSSYNFWGKFATWYLFIAAFLYMAIKRAREIKRNPSVFDFKRFSLATGDIHKRFLDFKFQGKTLTIRKVQTLLEPAFFLAIGLALWLIGQPIGMVIAIASVFYSQGYAAAFYKGDMIAQDIIDDIICREQKFNAFINDEDSSKTQGVRFYMTKPNGKEARERLADILFAIAEDDEFAEVK